MPAVGCSASLSFPFSLLSLRLNVSPRSALFVRQCFKLNPHFCSGLIKEVVKVVWSFETLPASCCSTPTFSLSATCPCEHAHCHLHLLAELFFFFFLSPILKPCWLVAWTQTPSAVIHPILSSSGAPADGGCRFMTHWLASSKNHPALHYTQKVLYPFYVKRTFSQVRFWQAWMYSCAQRHANSKYRLQQKAKTVMLSVDRASFSQTKKANCTSLAAHRLAACKVYPLFLLSRIKHENIVALEDIYESSNHLYLIMQL